MSGKSRKPLVYLLGAGILAVFINAAWVDDKPVGDPVKAGRPVAGEVADEAPFPMDGIGPECHCVHEQTGEPRQCWHDELSCNLDAIRDCEKKNPKHQCGPMLSIPQDRGKKGKEG